MARIKKRLTVLAERLGLNQALLTRAQRRYKANRKRAYIAHRQQLSAQKSADRARAKGYNVLAEKRDRQAAQHSHVAFKNHSRAQVWLGRIKTLTQRIEGIGSSKALYEGKLKELRHVTITGNSAKGGTRHERLKAVALASAAACASGKRPNFYSQAGSWDVSRCITGERYGERSDCSSWFTSVYKAAGLSDPNDQRYTGGYTGTLGANGKEVSLSEAKPGDAVLYGSYPHHHVEMYVGPGERTIGHGSSPVDAGTVNLFGDGDYHLRRFV